MTPIVEFPVRRLATFRNIAVSFFAFRKNSGKTSVNALFRRAVKRRRLFLSANERRTQVLLPSSKKKSARKNYRAKFVPRPENFPASDRKSFYKTSYGATVCSEPNSQRLFRPVFQELRCATNDIYPSKRPGTSATNVLPSRIYNNY